MNKECVYGGVTQTILEHYTTDGVINPNIMNDILSPNYRSVLRYMYNGHNNYFNYIAPKFDDNGDLET
jgi:hypothetical protein